MKHSEQNSTGPHRMSKHRRATVLSLGLLNAGQVGCNCECTSSAIGRDRSEETSVKHLKRNSRGPHTTRQQYIDLQEYRMTLSDQPGQLQEKLSCYGTVQHCDSQFPLFCNSHMAHKSYPHIWHSTLHTCLTDLELQGKFVTYIGLALLRSP